MLVTVRFDFNEMWRNNGDGKFTQVTDADWPYGLDRVMAPLAPTITMIGRSTLLWRTLLGIGSPTHRYLPESAGREVRPPRSDSATGEPTFGVAVLDFDHDGWMDLAFTHGGSPGLTLWRNNHGKTFERVTLPETNWVRAYGVAAFDYDNDGWVDLVAVGETKDGKGEVRLFRNLGADGFKDVTADVGLDKIQLKEPRAIITGDYDGDGATDLLITQNHGPAVLLRNEGGNQNHWLRLSLKGLADNKSAIGTKVEVFAGRQPAEV